MLSVFRAFVMKLGALSSTGCGPSMATDGGYMHTWVISSRDGDRTAWERKEERKERKLNDCGQLIKVLLIVLVVACVLRVQIKRTYVCVYNSYVWRIETIFCV
jgi:hypothetical protein